MNKWLPWIIVNFVLLDLNLLALTFAPGKSQPILAQPPAYQQPYTPPSTPSLTAPRISTKIPGYQDYNGVVEQLRTWSKEAPELTETFTYGQSADGAPLCGITVHDKRIKNVPVPKILITACIHGNEPLAASVVMGYLGTMLGTYTVDPAVTELIQTRSITFVPVVSPDSYPNSRYVNGVDPNRDFPGPRSPTHRSVPPVAALEKLFLDQKFNAVISGHTFGRVFLTPFGDQNGLCPHNSEYERIIGQMCNYRKATTKEKDYLCWLHESGAPRFDPNNIPDSYRMMRASELYGKPIYGSEVDWYYRNGAFKTLPNGKTIKSGCFAIVMEFGTHQRIPTQKEIIDEFDMTWKAFLYFLEEAPKVEIWWDEAGRSVNPDGTPKL